MSARSHIRNYGSVRRARTPDSRTWGTSWNVTIFAWRRRRYCRQRREGDQLLLDFGAEPIGDAALWIGRADGVERRQRFAEVATGHQRPGVGQNHFAAARKDQGDLARDRRRHRRFRRRELSGERQDRPDTEDRSEVDATPRGHERAGGEKRGQRHNAKHRTPDRRAAGGGARQRGAGPRQTVEALGRYRRGRRLESIQAFQHGKRFLGWRAAVDSGLEQATGLVRLAALEGSDSVLKQLFGLALPLGQRATRAVDVGARPWVTAIDEQRSRPDVDGELVAGREVVIETEE